MKDIKVNLTYWVEFINGNGIQSESFEETIPLDGLIAMGTQLQTTMIDHTIESLTEDAIAITGSGVNVSLSETSEDEDYSEITEDLFEPRLKQISKMLGD